MEEESFKSPERREVSKENLELKPEIKRSIYTHLAEIKEREESLISSARNLREKGIFTVDEYRKIKQITEDQFNKDWEQIGKSELDKELQDRINEPTKDEYEMTQVANFLSELLKEEIPEDTRKLFDEKLLLLTKKINLESAKRRIWKRELEKLEEERKKRGKKEFRESIGGITPP